jgi:hypothetical protein
VTRGGRAPVERGAGGVEDGADGHALLRDQPQAPAGPQPARGAADEGLEHGEVVRVLAVHRRVRHHPLEQARRARVRAGFRAGWGEGGQRRPAVTEVQAVGGGGSREVAARGAQRHGVGVAPAAVPARASDVTRAPARAPRP